MASAGSGAAKPVWQPTARKTARSEPSTPPWRLLHALWALQAFLAANDVSLVNHAAHYRLEGKRVSTAVVESRVNRVIGRRMAKKQQMRWSYRATHLLVQIPVAMGRRALAAPFSMPLPSL
jgi:hypothetical protein